MTTTIPTLARLIIRNRPHPTTNDTYTSTPIESALLDSLFAVRRITWIAKDQRP